MILGDTRLRSITKSESINLGVSLKTTGLTSQADWIIALNWELLLERILEVCESPSEAMLPLHDRLRCATKK